MNKKDPHIKGYILPAPRLTSAGYWAVLRCLIVPFLAALLALDTLLFVLFHYGFGRCYGLLCLL